MEFRNVGNDLIALFLLYLGGEIEIKGRFSRELRRRHAC
jgi:hypothetical protein